MAERGGRHQRFAELKLPEFRAGLERRGVKPAVGGAEDDGVVEDDGRALDAAAGLEFPGALAGGAVDGVEVFVARTDEDEAIVNRGRTEKGQGAILVGPGDFAADDVERDGLVGVVAAERHGAEGADGGGNLGFGGDFVDEGAVLEVDDVQLGVAAAEDEEAAVDDAGRAVDVVVGLVTPDEFAVGGVEHAGGAVVAVEQHPVGGAVGGFDGDGAGADFVVAGELPGFLAGVGGEGVEPAVVGGEEHFAAGDRGRGGDGVLGGEGPERLAGISGEAMQRALGGADEDAVGDEGGLGGNRAGGGEGPRDDRVAGRGRGDMAAEGGAAAGHGPGGLRVGRLGRRFFRGVGRGAFAAAGQQQGRGEQGRPGEGAESVRG